MRTLLLLLISVLSIACDSKPADSAAAPSFEDKRDSDSKTYTLAVHPLHNPRTLIAAYQPLINHLNEQIPGTKFAVEASRDYQAYESKFYQRGPEMLLPNPWQTLEAIKKGYRVIAMAGDAEDFKGIFIVRKDSGINTPQDLKGKTVSYPSHTALAACIMPQRYLHDNGLDIRKDIQNSYVGSQESSIMNAFLGDSAAGATWPPPWRLFQKERPEEAAQLKVIWETEPLKNNSIMVRDDVPADLARKVAAILYSLHETEEGQTILKQMETARFYKASNESYEPVQDFVNEFEKDVRLVANP